MILLYPEYLLSVICLALIAYVYCADSVKLTQRELLLLIGFSCLTIFGILSCVEAVLLLIMVYLADKISTYLTLKIIFMRSQTIQEIKKNNTEE